MSWDSPNNTTTAQDKMIDEAVRDNPDNDDVANLIDIIHYLDEMIEGSG